MTEHGKRDDARIESLKKLLEASNASNFDDEFLHLEIWRNSRAYYSDGQEHGVVYTYNEQGKIEQWLHCYNCGKDGFISEMPNFDDEEDYCEDCIKEMSHVN